MLAMAAIAGGMAAAPAGAAPPYVPGRVVVGYRSAPSPMLQADIASRTGARPQSPATPDAQLYRVPAGESLRTAIARLRAVPGVAYAVPDYLAHTAGGWLPDDPGRGPGPRDWQQVQWNLLPGVGVDAPDAWGHLLRDEAPGGSGVVVAILDTGVAYRDWTDPRTGVSYGESPDFNWTSFSAPCDLIRDQSAGSLIGPPSHRRVVTHCADPYALDRNGHGTLVAGLVGESTNNGVGVTGLAYGATIMPVRVLDAEGNGDSLTIARGIRYAVVHGAQIINLSLEFTPNGPDAVHAGDIPEVLSAIHFAYTHGVMVIAAAGNDSLTSQIAYPAADQPEVVSVGGTTKDGCLADYSNAGPGLDLVAPGGGDDSSEVSDPSCHPGHYIRGGDIYQMTFPDPDRPRHFGLPGGWYGTSMSAPEVAGAAALVIASGVLGAHPTPDQVLERLEQTAQPLGTGRPNAYYGWGLLNAGAATAGNSRLARSRRAHHHRRRHHHHKTRRRHHRTPPKGKG